MKPPKFTPPQLPKIPLKMPPLPKLPRMPDMRGMKFDPQRWVRRPKFRWTLHFRFRFSLRGVWVAFASAVWTAIMGSGCLITLQIKPTEAGGWFWTRNWARGLLWLAGVRLQVHGRERLPGSSGYIMMANHQSHYDIPAIFQGLQLNVRFIAKVELFKVPIFGPAIQALGHVAIDRRNRESAVKSLALAAQRMHDGLVVLAFPEGSRYSNPGHLGVLKKGPFHLVQEIEATVVPIWIDGTMQVSPSGELVVRKGPVNVQVGTPISADTIAGKSVDDVMALVRAGIEAARDELYASGGQVPIVGA